MEAPLTSLACIAHYLEARSTAIQWSAERRALTQPVWKDPFKADDINPAAQPDYALLKKKVKKRVDTPSRSK